MLHSEFNGIISELLNQRASFFLAFCVCKCFSESVSLPVGSAKYQSYTTTLHPRKTQKIISRHSKHYVAASLIFYRDSLQSSTLWTRKYGIRTDWNRWASLPNKVNPSKGFFKIIPTWSSLFFAAKDNRFWYMSNRICQTKTKYCSKAIPNTKWPKTRSSWRHDVFEFWLYKNGQLLPTIKYSEIKSVMWRKIWLTHIIGDLYCQYNLEELNNFFIFSNKLLSYYKHFRRSILIWVTIGRGQV